MSTQASEFDPKGWFTRHPAVIGSKLPAEWVLLHQDSGVYFGVQGLGHDIWTALQKPCDLEGLLDTLQERYGAERAQLQSDVLPFLKQLFDDGLMVPCREP